MRFWTPPPGAARRGNNMAGDTKTVRFPQTGQGQAVNDEHAGLAILQEQADAAALARLGRQAASMDAEDTGGPGLHVSPVNFSA